MPACVATNGSQSTGIRSMKFMKKIHTNSVSANGAIRRLVPWKVSRTLLSTNSTMDSMKAWKYDGTPLLACFATRRKRA